MIGSVGGNYSAVVGNTGYLSGATLGAARTSLATSLNANQVVTPVSATPEVFSNAQTTRVQKTPAQLEKARNEAYEAMRFSTGRTADNINGTNFKLPFEKELEMAQKEAMGLTDEEEKVKPEIKGLATEEEKADPELRMKKQLGIEECETCKNRTYVDDSDEADVSFKTPGHIDPSAAAGTVMAHEQMHVANAVQEGMKDNKELVSATVSLKTATCPECGKTYVAGGVTKTLMKTTADGSNINKAKVEQASGADEAEKAA